MTITGTDDAGPVKLTRIVSIESVVVEGEPPVVVALRDNGVRPVDSFVLA